MLASHGHSSTRANKRTRESASAGPSSSSAGAALDAALPDLAASLALLTSLVEASPIPPIATVVKQLGSTLKRVDRTGDVDARDVQDELDEIGVKLWNLKGVFTGKKGNNTEHKLATALLKLVAFKLVALGSVLPLADESAASLLGLATNTSHAFLEANEPLRAEDVLAVGAQYLETITSDPPSSSFHADRALLNFYCARIKTSLRLGKLDVATWLRGKANEILRTGDVGAREVEAVARAASEAGSSLIPSSPGPTLGEEEEVGDARASSAVEWLLWSSEVLEGKEGVVSKSLQTSTLKNLYRAYLRLSPPSFSQAESCLTELLSLQPSLSNWKRLIGLLITRGAGDAEILEAFKNGSETLSLNPSNGPDLLGQVQRLSEDRRALRFSILDVLINALKSRVTVGSQDEEDDELGTGPQAFLAHIIMFTVFLVDVGDRQRFEDMLDRVPQDLKLTKAPAFTCVTYIWRQGDRMHAENKLSLATEWYLIGSHRVFSSIAELAAPKSFRKAVLCYVELGNHDEAEAIMARAPASNAKNLFVTFYLATLRKDEAQALKTLRALLVAPDFTLNMLLWAARTAQDSGIVSVLKEVLEGLLQLCINEPAPSLDLITLVRCVIRLVIKQVDVMDSLELAGSLRAHFEAALTVARTLSDSSSTTESIRKNVTWLHKTGYNFCTRFSNRLEQKVVTDLYVSITSLMEFDCKLTRQPDLETLSRIYLCRLFQIAASLNSALEMSLQEEKSTAARQLLNKATELRGDISAALLEHPKLDRTKDIQEALGGIEVQLLSVLGDWSAASQLLDDLEESAQDRLPIHVIKSISALALAADNCPSDVLTSILERSLQLLYRFNKLDIVATASWLRLVIKTLLHRKLQKEALVYLQNACQLVKSHQTAYSRDEVEWRVISQDREGNTDLMKFVSRSWDEGLNLFYSNAPKLALEWCSLALEIAQVANLPVAAQLQSNVHNLARRFPASDDD